MALSCNMSLLYSLPVVSEVRCAYTRRGLIDHFCALPISFRPYYFSVHQPILKSSVYIFFVCVLSPKLQKVTQPIHAKSWKWRFDASLGQSSTSDWRLLNTPASSSLRSNKSETSVKDCEGSEILPCLQASRLACHSFLDANRRRESVGPETNDFMTAQQAAWTSRFHWFPLISKSRGGDVEWSRWMLCTQWVCVVAEGPQT